MVRLIPLPDRDGRPGDSRLWINPEHVTSLAPSVNRSQDQDGDVFTLLVELKLEGLTMQWAWLATCVSINEADASWRCFLDLVAGPDLP